MEAIDVVQEFGQPQKNPETAPVRDAIAAAYAEGFNKYEEAAEYAAAQSDPLRATGIYLKGYAEEHGIIPGVGETEESVRARLFASPSIVTPDAIETAINEIIAPLECKISELDLDGWFIHAEGPSVWESFVGAEPNYPDRYYDDQPGLRVGGCVPSNNLPRSFHVRIPALNAQDEVFDYIGDGWFVGDDLNIYQEQSLSTDKYNRIIATVETKKGQGMSWSMVVEPSLAPPTPPTTTIGSLDIDLADPAGGSSHVLTGTNFDDVTDVLFGGLSALSFTIDGPTQITAVAPSHAAGGVSVHTTGLLGDSNSKVFEYWSPDVPLTSTSFLEAPDYTDSGATGIWTARTGFGTGSSASQPDETPTGTPKFIAANLDRLPGPDTTWDSLIGFAASGATVAGILDVDSIGGTASAVISDRDFFGALYILTAGSLLQFAYFEVESAGYKYVSVPVTTGRVVFVLQRVLISGTYYLRITIDGSSWTLGDPIQTMKNTTSGMWLGYHQDLSLYPLDATIKSIITVKQTWSSADVLRFYKWANARHP